MTASFKKIGARVGLYSTAYQWGKIAGAVKFTSPLAGLPSWLAGARSAAGAKAELRPPGAHRALSRVSMTQYISGGLDYNHSCS